MVMYAMYGYVVMAMYGYVWLCMAMYAMYGYVRVTGRTLTSIDL